MGQQRTSWPGESPVNLLGLKRYTHKRYKHTHYAIRYMYIQYKIHKRVLCNIYIYHYNFIIWILYTVAGFLPKVPLLIHSWRFFNRSFPKSNDKMHDLLKRWTSIWGEHFISWGRVCQTSCRWVCEKNMSFSKEILLEVRYFFWKTHVSSIKYIKMLEDFFGRFSSFSRPTSHTSDLNIWLTMAEIVLPFS